MLAETNHPPKHKYCLFPFEIMRVVSVKKRGKRSGCSRVWGKAEMWVTIE